MASTMRAGWGGFTLIEVMVASAISAVVAGGTMMAFVTAARMVRAQNSPGMAEASGFAQQTLERLRNRVAADDTFFTAQAGPTWWDDPLPVPGAGTNSESILWEVPTSRKYRVTAEDCDGVVAGPPDCYAVAVKVCWNGAAC